MAPGCVLSSAWKRPAASRRPSRLTANDPTTIFSDGDVRISVHEPTCHALTFREAPPASSSLLSVDHARPNAVWDIPVITVTGCQVRAFHTRRSLSAPDEASHAPSGEKATAATSPT